MISREISRNCGQRGYRHQQADRKATARRQEASPAPREIAAAPGAGFPLRHPLPFLGTGPEQAHQRPGARVLPERDGLPPGDGGAGAGGGGPAQPSASEGFGGSYPGGGLCPCAGSPLPWTASVRITGSRDGGHPRPNRGVRSAVALRTAPGACFLLLLGSKRADNP